MTQGSRSPDIGSEPAVLGEEVDSRTGPFTSIRESWSVDYHCDVFPCRVISDICKMSSGGRSKAIASEHGLGCDTGARVRAGRP